MIIPICFQSIDLLGQGAEPGLEPGDEPLPGRWHFVIDEDDASK